MPPSAPGQPARLRAAAAGLRWLAPRAWFLEPEVAAVAGLVPRGGTCIDVGAEYGLYTVAMAAAVGAGGTVHAVEPQPDVQRVLAGVVRSVGAGDVVTVHRVALGTDAGSATLSVPRRRGLPVHGRAFLTTDARHGGPNEDDFADERRVDVEVTTLDTLVGTAAPARVDLLKADVEGAELQVLRGGRRTLERFRPVVQLEVEEPHLARYGLTATDLTDLLLDELGYAMHAWGGDGWEPADAVTPARRNYLFVPMGAAAPTPPPGGAAPGPP